MGNLVSIKNLILYIIRASDVVTYWLLCDNSGVGGDLHGLLLLDGVDLRHFGGGGW